MLILAYYLPVFPRRGFAFLEFGVGRSMFGIGRLLRSAVKSAVRSPLTIHQRSRAVPRHAKSPGTPKRFREGGFTLPKLRERSRAFTLLEMLVVMGIIAILMALVVPAFTNLKSASDVTSAANTIKGVLDQARTYAMANNTYTWVGFHEEDGSVPSPSSPGTGRLVISIVASKDGTMLYTTPLTSLITLAPANLIQVGKLTKIDNAHLKTFPAPTAVPPPDTFDTRPAVSSTAAQIGSDPTAPPNPSLLFRYPVGGTAQYQFTRVIQFSPRGDAVIDNNNYTLTPVSEIGLQPAHGSTPDTNTRNVVAIQVGGVGGNVKIYRR
jgi:prepilin-type N-terminal cleavage/methylation domain-containing protein